MLFVFLLLTPCTVASGCTLWATLSVFVTKSPASVRVSLFCPFDFLMRRIITAVTLFSSTNTCFFFFFGMKLTQSNLLNSRQFWLVVLNYRCFFFIIQHYLLLLFSVCLDLVFFFFVPGSVEPWRGLVLVDSGECSIRRVWTRVVQVWRSALHPLH